MLQRKTIDEGTLALLIKLQQLEILKDFDLVGGTALALQLGHRKSVDLDLYWSFSKDANLRSSYRNF